MKFTCPNCGGALFLTDAGTAKCPKGHSFDKSRDGYYNLLLGASGGTHGDNREMLLARRRFLDTGAYQPLSDRINEILLKNAKEPYHILDMGCGEGYYTDRAQKALSALSGFSISAFDISKEAVRLAAKKNKSISFAVASSYKIPSADSSFDAVYNIFSPLATEETARVLKSGGIFIAAVPDARHLYELKSQLYEKPYLNEQHGTELSDFELLRREELSFKIRLDSHEKISDLFLMTPYAYRTGAEERARLSALGSLDCSAEFIIYVYKRM